MKNHWRIQVRSATAFADVNETLQNLKFQNGTARV